MNEIIHINSYYISSTLHKELVSKLKNYGYKQHVYIPIGTKKHYGKYDLENSKNVKITYSYCFNKISRLLWPIKILKIWLDFKKVYRYNSNQIIHAHTLIVNGIIAYLAYKKWKTPYIITIRNTDINFFLKRSFIIRKIATKILDKASVVITLSPAYKDIQLPKFLSDEKYNCLKKKISVIPNGINDYWLENKFKISKTEEIPEILFVGRLIKRKNLKTLIKACEILNTNGCSVKLNVVGDGTLLKYFEKRRYATEIHYYGKINDKNELIKLYRKSTLLAVPSFTESFGLIYPEAMSQGLPVIYTKGQGFDGFYPDGFIGFSINPKDPFDISDKIKRIISNHSYFSENAYMKSSDFSWDNVAKKLSDTYNTIFS